MYLFLWSFFWLKIAKNSQKWVYIGMGEVFFVWDFKKLSERAEKYTAHFIKSTAAVTFGMT